LELLGDIVIERPIEEVFALLADACNEPLYNPHTLKEGADEIRWKLHSR
jgi:hypothetical protein